MLVEFERTEYLETEASGEDDEFTNRVYLPIKINPAFVGAMFASRDPDVCIVRLADGRGFRVRGSYPEVANKLEANGSIQAE